MKTYEDWIEQQDPTKTIPLKDAWNAAIEAMRQDCEPVAWKDETTTVLFVPQGSAPWKMDLPEMLYRHPQPQPVEKGPVAQDCGYCGEAIYLDPQPLRDLSREEIAELHAKAIADTNAGEAWVWRFAKLVREVK
jgi:hypothetical protein